MFPTVHCHIIKTDVYNILLFYNKDDNIIWADDDVHMWWRLYVNNLEVSLLSRNIENECWCVINSHFKKTPQRLFFFYHKRNYLYKFSTKICWFVKDQIWFSSVQTLRHVQKYFGPEHYFTDAIMTPFDRTISGTKQTRKYCLNYAQRVNEDLQDPKPKIKYY